jgi:hypothetical protein
MLQNMLWPRLLGGVDRPYIQVGALVSLAGLEKLAELAEENCFDVVIDSSWGMEDVLKVSSAFSVYSYSQKREEETLTCARRTSGY